MRTSAIGRLNPPRNGEGDRRRRRWWRGLAQALRAPSTMLRMVPLPVPGRNGFTLVELLVVLAIIGLMSAAVVLAVPDPRGGLTAEAERFAARTRAARELAVMDNRPIAVRVDAAGYGFDWRVEGEWRPLEQRPFTAQAWSEGTVAAVEGDAARIVFDSTGFAEPLLVTLARDAERVAVEVADGGEVHVRGAGE
jgi:general secretion pathway protein H